MTDLGTGTTPVRSPPRRSAAAVWKRLHINAKLVAALAACVSATMACISGGLAYKTVLATADMAQSAANLTKTQARASLIVTPQGVPAERNDNKNVFLILTVTNTGSTAAYTVVSAFHTDPMFLDPDTIVKRLAKQEGQRALGHQQTADYKISLKMTAEEYDQLAATEGRRYVYASLSYVDAFDDAHRQNACFYLVARKEAGRILPCDTFNNHVFLGAGKRFP